jgi:hypothetical protein
MAFIAKSWCMGQLFGGEYMIKLGLVWERGCGCVPKKIEFFVFFTKI